jgi:hypothetical protein
MPEFNLVMRTGPTPGKSFAITGEIATLGREPGNAVVINDAEISRRHARFSLQGNTYVLEDLGSTNGTFVNGMKLAMPHVLKDGEVISFGEQISCVFEIKSDVDPNATVISSKPLVLPPGTTIVSTPEPEPEPVFTPPPPPPSYVAQVPLGPEPVPPMPPKKNNRMVLFIILGLLLLCCCVCVGIGFYIDSQSLWCQAIPLIPGCGG